ncbi:hypothetical protein SPHINGO391_450136 [Sphingomonas aurantiaca]|uniref:Uncharacterized protein n=1 Tax=Sphingomonas aurantiaca TaxID=185949 RepID=A0A5E7ZG00_9SPHN|nr:hypothetical protein SPHINGO391_450136 [Sphingomonas aurantiaca]
MVLVLGEGGEGGLALGVRGVHLGLAYPVASNPTDPD